MDTKIIQNSDNISTELAKNSKKPIERKAADISDWLEIQVSIVKGISPKIIAKKTLREIVQELKRTDQKALNFATKLRNLYDQDKTGYSKEKEKNCPGFIVGDFSYRNSTGINTFIPLQVFDIDHVGDSLQVSFILEELKKLPYVFLAYPSPSYTPY